MKGYQPANCGDPEKEITGLSDREAYGEATRYIEQDPASPEIGDISSPPTNASGISYYTK